MTISGSGQAAMTRLMRNVNLDWSIQNGVLQILSKGVPLAQTAILLTPQTGLLESPHSAVNASVHLTSTKSTKTARKQNPNDPSILKLKTMLIPGMVPGRKVDLRTELYNGGYVLTECLYKGESWSTEWFIESTARIY
jgi:hypothetical protein